MSVVCRWQPLGATAPRSQSEGGLRRVPKSPRVLHQPTMKLQDTIPLDSLLVSGFREGREGATESPSSAHGRQEPRSPRGPHGGGGVIWLGVIQHPGRLALSRSMPEPGAHSILPCFATGPVHRLLRIRLSQTPMRYHRRPPQWRSACLPDNAHHTAAMVAPSGGEGPGFVGK